MQAQAYEGYIENGRFYHSGNVNQLTGRRRAIITILDEPIPKTSTDNEKFILEFEKLSEQIEKEDKELRADWLKRLNTAINLSLDEELPEFQRSKIMRESINLTD